MSALVASAAMVVSLYEVDLLPPKLAPRQLQIGAATTHALVDFPATEGGRTAIDGLNEYIEVLALNDRARPLAQMMTSQAVLARVERRLDEATGLVAAAPQVPDGVPRVMIEPDSERRANQILAEADPYRLEVHARQGLPVLDIFAQAPSVDQAERLADASIAALNGFLRHEAREKGIPRADLVRLTQLGAARGGPVDPAAPMMIAGMTFVIVFAVTFGLLALLAAVVRGWVMGSGQPEARAPPDPQPPPVDADRAAGGNWPRTTRVLPWMIAGFLGLIFLVPFNLIELDVPLPVDLKLDRLYLVAIVLAWLVAFAIGGRYAPRWRFTPIHAAIAVFAGVAALGVVLNAAELNETLVLGLSIKKLSVLAAYVALFVVVASVVRPREVRAFMNLALVLAVICALGMLWEYRFHFNVFYEATVRLMPGFFELPTTWSGADDLGRLSVIGPTQVGLEAVALLAMSLPIALVRLMDAKVWRDRVLYGLAVAVLGAAILTTYRKSALIAPLAVVATLAYFRPRAALKLAPLAVAAVAVLAILSIDAFDSVAAQFQSDRLDVGTVSDRVSDYDAVRPNVLSHPAFGLGLGSYEHTYAPGSYRILDSELLARLVDTGFIGLAAFLLMIGTVIAVAVRVARGRDPGRAAAALAIAAAGIAFLVLTALFDEWGFPHAAYLFLTLAGLLASIGDATEMRRDPPVRPAVAVPSPETTEAAMPAPEEARAPAPV